MRLAAPLLALLLLALPLAGAEEEKWVDQDYYAGNGVVGPGGSHCDPAADPEAAGVEARAGGACWNLDANVTMLDVRIKDRVDTGGMAGAWGLYDAAGKALAQGSFCDQQMNVPVPAGSKVVAIVAGGAPTPACAPGSTPAGKIYVRFHRVNMTPLAVPMATPTPSMPPAASPTPSAGPDASPSPSEDTPQPAAAPQKAVPLPGLAALALALGAATTIVGWRRTRR